MTKRRVFTVWMPHQGEMGVIVVMSGGYRVEFRGNPYSQWEVDEDTPMFHFHAAMEGMRATVLHQEEMPMIWHRCPEFDRVAEMFDREVAE